MCPEHGCYRTRLNELLYRFKTLIKIMFVVYLLLLVVVVVVVFVCFVLTLPFGLMNNNDYNI